MSTVALGGMLIPDALSLRGGTISGDVVFQGQNIYQALEYGRQYEEVTDDKTLDAGDSGVVQVVTVDAKTITLPATAVGLSYTIMNGGSDGEIAVTVSPNSNDMIVGNGFTGANNKDAVNTKVTAKKGDLIEIVGDGAASVGWNCVKVIGTWAREG